MFDIGYRDLPVVTSGNWVIKCWVKLYVRFLNVFFQYPKNWLLRFLVVAHAFSNIDRQIQQQWAQPVSPLPLGCKALEVVE